MRKVTLVEAREEWTLKSLLSYLHEAREKHGIKPHTTVTITATKDNRTQLSILVDGNSESLSDRPTRLIGDDVAVVAPVKNVAAVVGAKKVATKKVAQLRGKTTKTPPAKRGRKKVVVTPEVESSEAMFDEVGYGDE
jgi:hypothetical protein